MTTWSKPSDEDYALFGRIIHIYSAIDFVLRYALDIMDRGGMLEAPWAGKTAKLSTYKAMKALRSPPFWEDSDKGAFDAVDHHRRTRNLVAHFLARRFPTEDAFIFMTMSAADFEQVYGMLPEADSMLYGVTDAGALRDSIPFLLELNRWCANLPAALAKV
ncbi:hypothetical protein ACFQX9_30045 [Bradyrhizobium sp. GCM10028915]|uniref:hypothetical protein n=1 Tax=Bradyrhizobium sp. GCM10028915 TaxID=3273385 RepID=UPI003609E5B9